MDFEIVATSERLAVTVSEALGLMFTFGFFILALLTCGKRYKRK